jgi:hypothetical protein
MIRYPELDAEWGFDFDDRTEMNDSPGLGVVTG